MNTLTILSEHPFVAEISDCLTCGVALPSESPTFSSESPRGTCRYHLCARCVFAQAYYTLIGGSSRDRWQAKMVKRLEQLGQQIARNSMMLATASPEVTQ